MKNKFVFFVSFCLPLIVGGIWFHPVSVFTESVGVSATVPAICGNGAQEGTEGCDDDNVVNGDGCSSVCAVEVGGGQPVVPVLPGAVCGNGAQEGAEGCDDGNLVSGDGCSNQCIVEVPAPICGNGAREGAEGCDDGNVQAGDGCSALCQAEIPPQAVCGNRQVENGEQCDDGNGINGDGCSNQCIVEAPAPICGNGAREGAEVCDDGNVRAGDGCSALCQAEIPPQAVCGNRQVENGEQCDDGNRVNGDGCSNQCRNEVPPQNNPNNNNNDGNGGGGSATSTNEDPLSAGEELTLAKFRFWLAGKTIPTIPVNGRVTSLTGDRLVINLPAHELPLRSVTAVEFRLGAALYSFVWDEGKAEYEVTFTLPASGVYGGTMTIYYEGGIEETVPISFQSLPLGRITDESTGESISGASVTLWQGSQSQHLFTNTEGGYGFVVPNESYSLLIKKDGYHDRQTPVFRVTNSVVNRNLTLIKKVPSIKDAVSSATTTKEKVAAGLTATSKKVQEEAEKVSQVIGDLVWQAQELADDPGVEKAAERIVTPVAAGAVVGAVIPSLWNVLFPLLRYIFLQPLLVFGKRKRSEWGMIYHSLTKLPVDLAVVRLLDANTKRVKQSRVTDLHGRYLFIAEPGEYSIEVQRSGFSFPSSLLKNVHSDGTLADIYHGEAIRVSDDHVSVTPNIPLDPVGTHKTPRRIVWEKRLRVFQHGFSLVGILLTLVSLYINPTWIIVSFLAVHLVIYFLFLRFIRPHTPKGWGIIYDKDTKQPVANAIVRLFTKEYNKLVSTQVTDKKGRYAFLVGPSTYYVTSEKTGYDGYKSEEIAVTSEKIQAHILKKDVPLVKKEE